jgi:hypothetical protein
MAGNATHRLGQCRPPGRKCAAPFLRSFASSRFQSHATFWCTGQPSAAYPIAGCNSSSRPLLPCAFSSVSQALIAPGTVTACADVFSIADMPCCSNQSIVAAAGARPEPFSA